MKEQNTDQQKGFKPSEEAQLAFYALKRAAEKVEAEESEAAEWAAYKAKATKAT